MNEFPKEGHCLSVDIELAKYLCNRPNCRPDVNSVSRDEAIGIGWNKTSHWWLKTKNSSKDLYTLEQLEPFYKKQEFVVGKWYKIYSGKQNNKSYIKISNVNNGYLYFKDRKYINSHNRWATADCINIEDIIKSELLIDLSEIQPYLSENDPDKELKMEEGKYYKCVYSNIECVFKYEGSNKAYYKDHNNVFSKSSWNFWKNLKLELATQEEIEWLDKCIKQNKFVPKEQEVKKGFKKGDYIILLKTLGSIALANYCYKIKNNGTCLEPEKNCYGNSANYVWQDCFNIKDTWRYATQEEIEEYNRLNKPFDVTSLKKYSFDKSFVLPDKWYVKATKENEIVIKDWRGGNHTGWREDLVMTSELAWNRLDFVENDYLEISYEQFLKYVLEKPLMSQKEVVQLSPTNPYVEISKKPTLNFFHIPQKQKVIQKPIKIKFHKTNLLKIKN